MSRSYKPQSHETRIQHQFDALSKAVLKYGARDYHRRLKNRRAHEVTFSELSEQELAKLSVTDEYFKDAFSFSVLGHDVSVTDEQLAEALQTLSADRRDIILLAFFLGMNIVTLSTRRLYDEYGNPHLFVDDELRRELETKLIARIGTPVQSQAERSKRRSQ